MHIPSKYKIMITLGLPTLLSEFSISTAVSGNSACFLQLIEFTTMSFTLSERKSAPEIFEIRSSSTRDFSLMVLTNNIRQKKFHRS